MYNLIQTIEARNDLDNFVFYMIHSLKNVQASDRFLLQYYEQIQKLIIFPFGYRGIKNGKYLTTTLAYRGRNIKGRKII